MNEREPNDDLELEQDLAEAIIRVILDERKSCLEDNVYEQQTSEQSEYVRFPNLRNLISSDIASFIEFPEVVPRSKSNERTKNANPYCERKGSRYSNRL